MAQTRHRQADHEGSLSPEEYLSRMRLNLGELVRFYTDRGATKSDVAHDAGLSGHQALENMLGGRHKGTRIDHVLNAVVYLGATPERIFMAPKAFAALIAKEPPSPLPQEPRLRSLASFKSPASDDSSQSVDRSRFPEAKRSRRSARTGTGDASNRCCTHTRNNQARWVLASRGMYLQATSRAHLLRPAGTPVRVRETNDLSQVA